jgi:hypothetical protein
MQGPKARLVFFKKAQEPACRAASIRESSASADADGVFVSPASGAPPGSEARRQRCPSAELLQGTSDSTSAPSGAALQSCVCLSYIGIQGVASAIMGYAEIRM